MGYSKEKASKFSHKHIIENELVKNYLKKCESFSTNLPIKQDYKDKTNNLDSIKDKIQSNIKRIITIDGGYQEVILDSNYPSFVLCYYSVGILTFEVDLLFNLEKIQTINPDDVGRLKNLDRFSFCLPIQNIKLKGQDFKHTIRKTIFDIFKDNKLSGKDGDSKDSLLNTIKWLIFKEYSSKDGFMSVACPNEECSEFITFKKHTNNFLDSKNDCITCKCGSVVYITDCFELHDIVDETIGAGGIISYCLSAFEVVLMFSIFRFLFESKSEKILSEILFIKDGSLALYSKLDDFSFKVIRPFLQFLYDKSLKDNIVYVNIVGLEKSGYFVEHLKNIEKSENKLKENSILLPNLAYIKRFITGENKSVFGKNTYFGIKMFVKKNSDLCFVLDVAIPFGIESNYEEYIQNPNLDDFLNLQNILHILLSLKCDLYDSSFIPVAVINKLISLSNIPSKKILSIFTKDILK